MKLRTGIDIAVQIGSALFVLFCTDEMMPPSHMTTYTDIKDNFVLLSD